MPDLGAFEVWFVTGSQHLYGPETLQTVARQATEVAAALDATTSIPVRVVMKPVVVDAEGIRAVMLEANAAPRCVGVIAWMHTFSPAKMWVAGLDALQRPLLHLHTQYHQSIPWDGIDMDFMNLNQAAHGDREFGFIAARMRLERKVVVGHWTDPEVHDRIGDWTRAAAAKRDWETGRIARFGDNMRDVAVTEGDKVEAQRRLGYSVNTFGVGDLVALVDAASDAEVDALVGAYLDEYDVAPILHPGAPCAGSLRDGARIEIGLRRFLEDGRYTAFTTTFEDLHGLTQLPGLAVQRLMRDGYGFGAEGDWKTASMVRAMKVMADGTPGGVSFMEDYTYHLDASGDLSLGAHMLEVCESIAAARPSLEVHPLSIGGKADPVRLVFDAHPGTAVVASITDMGSAVPDGGDGRGCRGTDPPAAAAARRARAVAPTPRPQDECRRVDLRRWLAPHQPRVRDLPPAARRLRLDVVARVRPDRRDHAARPVPRRASLERPVLPPRPRSVAAVDGDPRRTSPPLRAGPGPPPGPGPLIVGRPTTSGGEASGGPDVVEP